MILIILKIYVPYLRHRFINQKLNVKTGVHIFAKINTTDNRKKTFFSYFFSEIPNFSYMLFSENDQCFIGAFL